MSKSVKKALVLSICAIVLVGASVLGTIAYFTATDKVNNTFTVGKVEIVIDETKIDTDGITPLPLANRVSANKYKLIPSHTYIKDPVIHVAANSEDSYIFIKVTNDIAAVETTTTAKTIAGQIAANNWTAVQGAAGVYYKEYTSAATVTDIPVFATFTIKDTATATDLAPYSDSQKAVVIDAYTIQKEGTQSVADAWSKVNN